MSGTAFIVTCVIGQVTAILLLALVFTRIFMRRNAAARSAVHPPTWENSRFPPARAISARERAPSR